MNIAIIDYGAGNTQSVKYAFERIGIQCELTNDAEKLMTADGVIFPGVGNAGQAVEALKTNGLFELIPQLKQPVLGICLGMQMLCDYTEEGETKGLGIIPAKVKKFNKQVKVPQIGWNQAFVSESPLFEGVGSSEFFYFVHSYYVPVIEECIARANYGQEFTAAFKKDNFYALQFHPEKSGEQGETILKNFIEICESYQQ